MVASDQFPELQDQQRLLDQLESLARIECLAAPTYKKEKFPVYSMSMGSTDPSAPVLGFFGGVHGLERIGSQVVLAFLHSIAQRLSWDETLQWQLQRIRLVFVPLVNPIGMHLGWRSNGNGVDLMRNSPVVAPDASFAVGGQKFSNQLPWFRGNPSKMEMESQALCDFVQKNTLQSQASILVDVHSGFGVRDQIWFPYANSKEVFPNIAEIVKIHDALDGAFQNHVYVFEPQSLHYTTHGDLWDHLYLQHARHNQIARPLIPLTIEMGSWMWVKKNPSQIFSFLGAFNPVKPHRKKRILRRHFPLFEYLMRMSVATKSWTVPDQAERRRLEEVALKRWPVDPVPKLND